MARSHLNRVARLRDCRAKLFPAGPHRAAVLLKRGAEAELLRTEFLGRPAVEKYRTPKRYRLEALDEDLRRSRLRTEARLMAEARAAGVSVPILYAIDAVENKIVMEFVEGPTGKEALDRGGASARRIARAIGRDSPRRGSAAVV